jgi:hypothetical protein
MQLLGCLCEVAGFSYTDEGFELPKVQIQVHGLGIGRQAINYTFRKFE